MFTRLTLSCWIFSALLSLNARAVELSPASPAPAAVTKTMRVILIGDSTMAPRNGYGDALCERFQAHVDCINLAKNGRSSGSFRAEGLWDQVQTLLQAPAAIKPTYVLIQFGHNDQPGKPGRSTDLVTECPVNMARYAKEVSALGGIPVLVTPLTRRTFRNNFLQDDLQPWAQATREVARAQHITLLELNADSASVVQAMGEAEADTLAVEPPPAKVPAKPAADLNQLENTSPARSAFDHTHVGIKGAQLFAGIVEKELLQARPELRAHFKSTAGQIQRPQLTPEQAKAFSLREVLKLTGQGGHETIDPWDPLAQPIRAAAALKPDYIVDPKAIADGRRVFHHVQTAVSRALSDARSGHRKARIHILIKPGVYQELVYVPASAPITLYGIGTNAASTKITANLDAALSGADYQAQFAAQFDGLDADIRAMFDSLKDRPTLGTFGTAVLWIKNAGFQAKNITIENAYNKAQGNAREECPQGVCGDQGIYAQTLLVHHQALAVMVDGADKVQFEQVRLLGFQDTLYLKSPKPGDTVRSFFYQSYIEGDVDFIFGDATAFFYQSEIKSLGDRTNSYVGAPSTSVKTRYGFVFDHCKFTHDGSPNALAGKFNLARQWPHNLRCTPYGDVPVAGYACQLGSINIYQAPQGTITPTTLEAVGKMVVLHSQIGAHIQRQEPWANWNKPGTLVYRPAQFGTDDYLRNLQQARIDPQRLNTVRQTSPAGIFLAEFKNSNE